MANYKRKNSTTSLYFSSEPFWYFILFKNQKEREVWKNIASFAFTCPKKSLMSYFLKQKEQKAEIDPVMIDIDKVHIRDQEEQNNNFHDYPPPGYPNYGFEGISD